MTKASTGQTWIGAFRVLRHPQPPEGGSGRFGTQPRPEVQCDPAGQDLLQTAASQAREPGAGLQPVSQQAPWQPLGVHAVKALHSLVPSRRVYARMLTSSGAGSKRW